jgi:hypothetical protein
MGVVAVTLRIGANVHSGQQLLERLSVKIGATLLVLGLAQLVNMSVLNGYGRRRNA